MFSLEMGDYVPGRWTGRSKVRNQGRKNNSVFRVRKWVENGFTGLTLDWVLRHQLGVCQVVV